MPVSSTLLTFFWKERHMSWLLVAVVFFFLAWVAIRYRAEILVEGRPQPVIGMAVAVIFLFLGLVFFILVPSFVTVGPDEVGHMNRIYFGSPMKPGQIIAMRGQNGPQAEVLPPGFTWKFWVRVFYKVEMKPVIEVKTGFCGKMTTLDGKPLKDGQVFADEWNETDFQRMLDAEYFLSEGNGQRGPQISVLKPGKYRLNQYLYKVDTTQQVTDIESGFVGVVKSNVQQVPVDPEQQNFKVVSKGGLVAQVVPKGYKGVWKDVLFPGQYYLNNDAFHVIKIDTRVQTWAYIGGFLRRYIDLKLDQDGKIAQAERSEAVPVAITVRIEGWEIPLDSRILIQVTPENAPYVVASVGTIEEVETDVLTPTYRSVVRNVCGRSDRQALDLISKRVELEDLVRKEIVPEGEKAFITIKEVRFGEPAYPPELMVARLREQLASQLMATYEKEQQAQQQRIKTEESRALAEQQGVLVASMITKQAALNNKETQKLSGEGEKLRLVEIAEGQRAQVMVLGEANVLQLAMLKEILEAAVKNPDIVKVPGVYVQGSTSGFEGAAAVLGASNLSSVLSAKPVSKPATTQPAQK
jgi:hypothetical protein